MKASPQKWVPYDGSKDYCGPEDSPISKVLSRYVLGIDLNKAYYKHDMRYLFGETEDDKHHADYMMWEDQRIIILRATHWWSPRRYLALGIALRRYHAVCLLGSDAFWSCKHK